MILLHIILLMVMLMMKAEMEMMELLMELLLIGHDGTQILHMNLILQIIIPIDIPNEFANGADYKVIFRLILNTTKMEIILYGIKTVAGKK